MSVQNTTADGAMDERPQARLHRAARSPQPGAKSTQLRGRRLRIAWIAWISITFLSITIFLASVPARFDELVNTRRVSRAAVEQMGLSPNFLAGYSVTIEVMLALAFVVVALIVFFRRADDGVAIFVSIMLVLVGTSSVPLLPTIEALIHMEPTTLPLVRFMVYLTWTTVFIFFCIYPDGRFDPPWARWFAVFTTVIGIPWNMFPESPLSPWNWPSPMLIPLELFVWGTSVYILIHKYRHTLDPVQKQQTRWAVYGLSLSVIGILAFFMPRFFDRSLGSPANADALLYYLVSATAVSIFALFTPLSIGISVLRYQLWAIDPIIHRTLVYVPLTAILGGVYTASIVFFQRAFIAITGEASDAVYVMSSLILASAFTPVKNALQTTVDRRYKGPGPIEQLEQFGQQVHSVVDVFDIHLLAKRLLNESVDAFDAKGGGVYLSKQGRHRGYQDLKLTYTACDWNGEAAIGTSLRWNDTLYGVMVLGPRRNGMEYSPEDRAKLHEAGDVVAQAIGLAELTESPLLGHRHER